MRIVFGAHRAGEEVVADQDSSRGAWTGNPPADSEGRTGAEVRKYLVFKSLELGRVNAKCIRWSRRRRVRGHAVWACASFAVSSPHAIFLDALGIRLLPAIGSQAEDATDALLVDCGALKPFRASVR